MGEIGDDLFVILIMGRARLKLPPDILEKFREEVNHLRFGEKDKNLVRQAGIALARKYPFLTKWGPEIILVVCAVQYGARMGNALRKVNALPDLPKPGPVEIARPVRPAAPSE